MTKAGTIARAVVVFAVLATTTTTVAGQGSNRALVVDDDLRCARASFSTIQSALDAAQPGATIRVCAGTYIEELFIRTPVRLTAARDQAIVQGFILVLADDVEIDGMVVDVRGNRPAGITVEVTQRVVIRNNTVFNGTNAGIEVFEADDTIVTKNTVHDNSREGVRLIEAFDSEVIDNISNNNGGDGIGVFEGANNLVRSNSVAGNLGNGINVCFDTRLNRVDRNTATRSGVAGISICDGATDSAVTKNRSFGNPIDALDESVGSGTAGTDSLWRNNTCGTSNPPGLCRTVRRQRSSSSSE
jgi:parallel beta-helix repeat protein